LLGNHLDVSFNAVGGSTTKKDLALLNSGGRLFLFGGSEMIGGKFGILSTLNFLRKMGVFIPVKFMMQSKNILGVNMLKIADNRQHLIQKCLSDVIDLHKKGEIRVVCGGSYNYTELAKAHKILEEGQSMGKISIKW
jgi:NADPH2:quinone reductase